jgi:hypothetical protein
MRKCKQCGALKRINYPFGKASGGVSVYIREHDSKCPFAKH